MFIDVPKIRTKSRDLGLQEIDARILGAGPFLFQLPELSSRLRPTLFRLCMRVREQSLTAIRSPMRNPKLREVSDRASNKGRIQCLLGSFAGKFSLCNAANTARHCHFVWLDQ